MQQYNPECEKDATQVPVPEDTIRTPEDTTQIPEVISKAYGGDVQPMKLVVKPYDLAKNLYIEPNHNFIVQQTPDGIAVIGVLLDTDIIPIDTGIMPLNDEQKRIATTLGLLIHNPEDTTRAQEDTTQAQEDTTRAQEDTTQIPEVIPEACGGDMKPMKLVVKPYDSAKNLYIEPNHNFIVRHTPDGVFVIGVLLDTGIIPIDTGIMPLNDEQKRIATTLGLLILDTPLLKHDQLAQAIPCI